MINPIPCDQQPKRNGLADDRLLLVLESVQHEMPEEDRDEHGDARDPDEEGDTEREVNRQIRAAPQRDVGEGGRVQHARRERHIVGPRNF